MSLFVDELSPWERKKEYYNNIQLGKDVRSQTEAINKSTQAMVAAQMVSASAIIASQERISEGIDNLSYGIHRVERGIAGLQAAFEWGISEVVWQIEQNRAVLKGILEVLSAPLDTQAKELRKRAEQAYANGWFEDALEDFLESEKKNRYDFSIHISIGMIYLFQKINKEKALEYFEKAIKYAKPTSNYHTSFALLHKGLIKRDFGLLNEAEKCAAEAAELSPDFAEALYQNAQYNVLLNRPDKSMQLLRQAIKLDVNYCEKTSAGKDFEKAKDHVNRLFIQLRDEEGELARRNLTNIEKNISVYNDLLKEIKAHETIDVQDGEMQGCLGRIRELIRRNSYRDHLEANRLIATLPAMYRTLTDDIKSQLNRVIQSYSSDIYNLKNDKIKKIGSYRKILGKIWIGVIVPLIIGMRGCYVMSQTRDSTPFSSLGMFLGISMLGAMIIYMVYFVLELIISTKAESPPAKVDKIDAWIGRTKTFIGKLDATNV